MDYIAGMSSAQGLSQKYSDDLATRASEISSAKANYAELGSQYHQQLSTYKNMFDKPFETLGEVAGEYVAGKAIGLAKSKYLAYKQGKAKAQQDAEVANNDDVAPSTSSSASAETSSENIAPEPDINAGIEGTELSEMSSVPVRSAEMGTSTEGLGESSAETASQTASQAGLEADSGARGALSATDVESLTEPSISASSGTSMGTSTTTDAVADTPSLPDAPSSAVADTASASTSTASTTTSAVAETGESVGEKVATDAVEDTALDATGLGEILMAGQVADAVGHFFKNIFDPHKPKPPPPPTLPPVQQANFIQASVQQGT